MHIPWSEAGTDENNGKERREREGRQKREGEKLKGKELKNIEEMKETKLGYREEEREEREIYKAKRGS